MNHTIIETLNGVRILQREDGKYGLEDLLAGGQPRFAYRTLEMARKTAISVSDENDRIDAYERSKS